MSEHSDVPLRKGSEIPWRTMRGRKVTATVESIGSESPAPCVTLAYEETSENLEGERKTQTRRETVKMDILRRDMELARARPGTDQDDEPLVIMTDWQKAASGDAPSDWQLQKGATVCYYRCNGERVLARVATLDLQEGICHLQYSSQDRQRSAVVRIEDLWRMQQQRLLPLAFSELSCRDRPLPIDEVEKRGVTISQLDSLMSFVKKRCTAGHIIDGWRCGRSDEMLRASTINLYQVCDRIIKPFTMPSRCSYVEAVAESVVPQLPKWFVSHWWGEAVCDFIKCLRRHSEVRTLGTIGYWVCAYANRQHELGTDLAVDPMKSSFLKAMVRCDGVLLVLDAEATPFTRIWCCFEEGIVTLSARGLLEQDTAVDGRSSLQELVARDGSEGREQPLQLDIVTVGATSKKPELLTEGLTDAEQEAERSCSKHGWKMKSEREASFPLEVVERCLDIDIREASASQDIDKTRILNALARCETKSLDEEPDFSHSVHGTINEALRSQFAVAMWRRAVQDGKDISSHSSDLPLAKILRRDYSRKGLQLHLARLKLDSKDLADVTSCFGTLKKLTRLHLDFGSCEGLTSVAELGQGLAKLQMLTQLHLDLYGCTGLTSVAELGQGLAKLQMLKELDLNLFGCTGLTSVAELGQGLAKLQMLTQLRLNLYGCTGLNSVAELGQGLAKLQMLKELDLNLDDCIGLTSVAEMGRGLAKLQMLTQLHLDLGGCAGLARELRGTFRDRLEFVARA
eukprot:TRINITY_DN6141_c0_g1_i1.p1 TRINITY_DN6141_c0_g1~~TRINITY_DN6141_c0_g1_i1.p1  ORF type:complete len:742 (-),score=184.38 TRINITY_DN6141_c0_g1_i1:56-2281(-)